MSEENFIRGWFRTYRSLENWEWYRESYCVHLFIHLLIKANHKPKKWRGIDINRGQLITSIEHLSNQTGISIQSVRTVLKRFLLTNEITIQSTSRYTLITISNYDSYQDLQDGANKPTNKPTNKQITSNQQATNKQLTTNKNVNNYKELNNNIYNEILENSEMFFDTLGKNYDLELKENLKYFENFYRLNFAEKIEVFNTTDVKKYYQHKLPYLVKKTVGKKEAGLKTNRPKSK